MTYSTEVRWWARIIPKVLPAAFLTGVPAYLLSLIDAFDQAHHWGLAGSRAKAREIRRCRRERFAIGGESVWQLKIRHKSRGWIFRFLLAYGNRTNPESWIQYIVSSNIFCFFSIAHMLPECKKMVAIPFFEVRNFRIEGFRESDGIAWKINGWNIIIGVWFRSFSFTKWVMAVCSSR